MFDTATTTVDPFIEAARRLAPLRRKTIANLTAIAADDLKPAREEKLLIRRLAYLLRRQARGGKLGRRIRRKAALGRAGSF